MGTIWNFLLSFFEAPVVPVLVPSETNINVIMLFLAEIVGRIFKVTVKMTSEKDLTPFIIYLEQLQHIIFHLRSCNLTDQQIGIFNYYSNEISQMQEIFVYRFSTLPNKLELIRASIEPSVKSSINIIENSSNVLLEIINYCNDVQMSMRKPSRKYH